MNGSTGGWGLAAALLLVGCAATDGPAPVGTAPRVADPRPVEATSLLGAPLRRPELDADFRATQERLLAEARARLAEAPGDVEAAIWVGRRTAYLGRYGEAIAHYTAALERHPDEPRLLRHRGHRYLTVRRLDDAVADLERAARAVAGRSDEIEPDGLPNPAGIPTSTLHANIYYHLGLAYYLQGRFAESVERYRDCARVSTTSDMFTACSYWLYLGLRRLGRADDAVRALGPITHQLELLENHSYHRLLLMFKGDFEPAELLAEARRDGGIGGATVAYGVAMAYRLADDVERAGELCAEIVAGADWPAFGYLAAEAELARSAAAG